MGKVKAAVMEGEEFAQEYFNIDRGQLIELVAEKYGLYSIEGRAALKHYDVIQREMDEYDQGVEDLYENPESILYT